MRYPPDSLKFDNHTEKILWMLNNNEYCLWRDFIEPPLEIPRASLSKYINRLREKDYISKRIIPEQNKPVYQITSSGQEEYIRKMGGELDFFEIMQTEKNKIQQQALNLYPFFKKYNIIDELIKIEFLSLYNSLFLNKILSIYTEEQINLFLLFLVENDLTNIENIEQILSIDDFIRRYNTDPDTRITNTDIKMIIQEVVDRERFSIKYFQIKLENDKYIFIRRDSDIGVIFETIVKKHLRNLNYLKSLNNSEIFDTDLEDIKKQIIFDLTRRYKIFDERLEEPVFHLVEDYIDDLQFDLHQKKYLEPDKFQEYFSISSPWIGLTHPFKPLSKEEEKDLIDIRSTFQHIREKEPKNQRYWAAREHLTEENFDLALNEIDKCLELEPNDYYAINLKSEILFESGKYEKALKIYEEASKLKPKYEDTFDGVYDMVYKAKILAALKRNDEALKILTNQIPEFMNEENVINEEEFYSENYYPFAQTFKIKASIYYQQKKFREALNEINKDIKLLDNTELDEENLNLLPESFLLKSKILYSLEEYKEAMIIINKAIKLKPNNPELYFHKADLYYLSDRFYSYFIVNKAIKLKPENKEYLNTANNIKETVNDLLGVIEFTIDAFFELKEILHTERVLTISEAINELNGIEKLKQNKFYDDIDRDLIKYWVEIGFLYERKDGKIILSDTWKKVINRINKYERLSRLDVFLIKLLEAFIQNKWNKISKEKLIQIIKLDERLDISYIKSAIDELIISELLVESDNDLSLVQEKIEKWIDESDFEFNLIKKDFRNLF